MSVLPFTLASANGIGGSTVFANGTQLKAGPNAGDTLVLAARNTTTGVDTALLTLTSGATPTIAGLSSGGGWDIEKTKVANSTNDSDALADDSELITLLAVGSAYLCEWCVIYSGNNAFGDFKYAFRLGANQDSIGQWSGFTQNINTSLTPVITPIVAANDSANCYHPSTTGVQAGTDGADSKIIARGVFQLVTPASFAGDGKVAFQFALITDAAGRLVTVYAGSFMRLKKLA